MWERVPLIIDSTDIMSFPDLTLEISLCINVTVPIALHAYKYGDSHCEQLIIITRTNPYKKLSVTHTKPLSLSNLCSLSLLILCLCVVFRSLHVFLRQWSFESYQLQYEGLALHRLR